MLSHRLQRACILAGAVAIVALSTWYLAAGVYTLARCWMIPQIISIAEPQPVGAALRVVAGQAMLQDWHHGYPIIPLPYGSLEYWLPGFVARALHLQEALDVLRVGRGMSLLALCAIALIYWRMLRQDRLPAWTVCIAMLPLFWAAYPLRWAAQFAPDFPAVALSLAGWCVGRPLLLRSADIRFGWWRIAAQVLVWTLAFHIKPTMMPGVLGYCIEAANLLLRPTALPRRRTALLTTSTVLSYAISSMLTAALVNVASHGGWYLNAIVSSAIFRYRLNYVWGGLVFHQTLLPVLVCYLLISVATARRLIASQAFLSSALIELLWMTKSGSNVNYLLGTISLFGLVLPRLALDVSAFARAGAAISASRLRHWLAPVLTLALAAALAVNARDALIPANEIIAPAPSEIAEVRSAVQHYGAGRVLCLDAFTAQRMGAFYPYAEPHHIAALTERRLVSLDDVTQQIRRRDFPVVVVNPHYFNPPVYHDLVLFPQQLRSAIEQNYTVVSGGMWLRFLAPKQ